MSLLATRYTRDIFSQRTQLPTRLTGLGLALTAMATLTACNYGADTQQAASVTDVKEASTLYYGTTTNIVLTGTGLNQSLQVVATGCKTLTEVTTADAKSDSKRTYACAIATPTAVTSTTTTPLPITVTRIDGTVLKTVTLTVSHEPLPTIDQFTATTAAYYSGTLTLNLTGSGFSKGLQLASTTCTGMAEVTGGTDTARSFTCKVPLFADLAAANQTVTINAQNIEGLAIKSLALPASYATSSTTVTDLTVTVPVNRYGSPANIVMKGTNLDDTVTLNGCANVTSKSATERDYTCNIAAVAAATELTFSALRADGFVMKTATAPLPPKPRVLIKTDLGDMTVELEPLKTPVTVNNFLAYVNENFYSGLIFHRVLKSAGILQGGGYTTTTPATKPNTSPSLVATTTAKFAPIVLESQTGLSNVRGTVAMARTSVLNSATSEVFFNTIDKSASYDYKASDSGNTSYTAFGTITDASGLATMDALVNIPVDAYGGGVPVSDTHIQSMTQTQ